MSAAAIGGIVFSLGELAVEATQRYQQAKADNAAALLANDKARLAQLDSQLADTIAGDDAAEKQLDADLGIGGTAT